MVIYSLPEFQFIIFVFVCSQVGGLSFVAPLQSHILLFGELHCSYMLHCLLLESRRRGEGNPRLYREEYIQVYTSIHKNTEVYTSMQKHTQVYTSIQVYTIERPWAGARPDNQHSVANACIPDIFHFLSTCTTLCPKSYICINCDKANFPTKQQKLY